MCYSRLGNIGSLPLPACYSKWFSFYDFKGKITKALQSYFPKTFLKVFFFVDGTTLLVFANNRTMSQDNKM